MNAPTARSPVPNAGFVLCLLLGTGANLVLPSCGPGSATTPRPAAGYAVVRTLPTTVRDHRSEIEFVLVPAGEFTMGGAGRDEVPRHRVRLTESFWLARTEVTVRQWQRFAADSGCRDVPLPAEGADAPMQVSYDEAMSFCRFYDYALPTEAQWEWACRAGDDSVPSHVDIDAMRAHAWYHHNAGRHAMPVGTRSANAFGLHDMLGNVWEWCADWYAPYPAATEPSLDPSGPGHGAERVLRGGSWFSLPPALPSTRARERPSSRSAYFGFRPSCARRTFDV